MPNITYGCTNVKNPSSRQPSTPTAIDLSAIFAPGGLLSTSLPGYQYRPGQRQMGDAIVHAIEAETSLAVEASTGIGKSFAYLAALDTLDTQAIISTETKVLQDQLCDKDIPLLAQALGHPIDAVVLKGRGNYVCELEFQKLEADAEDGYGIVRDKTHATLWPVLHAWVQQERAAKGIAELDEAPIDIPDDIRLQITTDHDRCLGRKCPLMASCFSERARARAKAADVVIVNHHLLLLDGKLGGQILPAKDVVIVDEAHALEEVASSVFSVKISIGRWTWLQRQFQKLSSPMADTVSELLNAAKSTEAQRDFDRWLDEVAQALDEARGSAETRFTQWATAMGDRRSMPIPETPELAPQIRHVHDLLRRIVVAATLAEVGEATVTLWDRVKRAAEHLASDLSRAFEEPPSEALVRFIENAGHWPVVRLVPIDVSSELRRVLWSRDETVIATSATLTTGGNFEFWRARVGAPNDLWTLTLSSPFDFPRQARLYLPRPGVAYEPAYPTQDSYDGYVARMVETLTDLIRASAGRALILCTSHRAMRLWADRVRPEIPWRVLVQGEASRHLLLREFACDVHSVLFATKSFWQGVDIAGESLSLLVIDKLPFPSPDDPVFDAQCALINRAKRGASFERLSLPIATLAVRQGFGRLIRRVSDRGVVAILDGRVQTKGYGRYILRSLPPAPQVYRLEDVQAFFAEEGGPMHAA
jgi:ATP-dependent DNA helicase DinG